MPSAPTTIASWLTSKPAAASATSRPAITIA